jgi:hypothetical protein
MASDQIWRCFAITPLGVIRVVLPSSQLLQCSKGERFLLLYEKQPTVVRALACVACRLLFLSGRAVSRGWIECRVDVWEMADSLDVKECFPADVICYLELTSELPSSRIRWCFLFEMGSSGWSWWS